MTIMDISIPQPKSVTLRSDHMICVGTSVVSKIVSDNPYTKNAYRDIAYFLAQRVCRPCVSAGTTVYLELSDAPPVGMSNCEEGYSITTSYERIVVTGYGPIGLYYGIQTLISLAERRGFEQYVPHVVIHDWPSAKTRGVMIQPQPIFRLETWKKLIDSLVKRKIRHLLIDCSHSQVSPEDLSKIIEHGANVCITVLSVFDADSQNMDGISRIEWDTEF